MKMKKIIDKEEPTKYYFYAYNTRHGVDSRTCILHVGCSCTNYNNYPTRFSNPISEDIAKKVYEEIKYLDGNENIRIDEAMQIIEEHIKNYC